MGIGFKGFKEEGFCVVLACSISLEKSKVSRDPFFHT